MKPLRIVFCVYLLLMGVLLISQPGTVLAQGETSNTESIEITTKFPKLEVISGDTAEFEVELRYLGSFGGVPRVFDLSATGPKDWYIQISPAYPKEKKIASIELQPGLSTGEKVNVTVIPAYWLSPEPGEYKVTLEATSGEIKGSIDLLVLVAARYNLRLVPATMPYNISATAGRDNYSSIKVRNTGSANIDNIAFSSDKPKDWAIDFSPDKVDLLAPGDSQTIDINIKPPSKTIAGDYAITLFASGRQASAEKLAIRVTVETPTIWGWVGVAIIAAVIGGVVYIFMRFGRR